jgi:hypothetical protein
LQPSNRAREQLGGNNCRLAIHPSAMTMQRSTQSVGQSVTRAANHPHPSMAEMNVQELHFYGSAPLRYVCQTVSEFLQDERTDGSFYLWSLVVLGPARGVVLCTARSHARASGPFCSVESASPSSRQAGRLSWWLAVVTTSLSHSLTLCVKDGLKGDQISCQLHLGGTMPELLLPRKGDRSSVFIVLAVRFLR